MPVSGFHDISFNQYIAFGAKVKVEYKTVVLRMKETHEERIGEWQDPLREYSIGPALRDQTDLDTVIAFFRARLGPQHPFKFPDPIDSVCTAEYIGTGNASQLSFQLVKRYNSGISGDTHFAVRPITLPDSGVRIFFDAVEQFSGFSVDLDDGIVTFTTPPGSGVLVTWTGTFQVPVAFVTTRLYTSVEVYKRFEQDIILREVRVPVLSTVLAETEPDDFEECDFPEGYSDGSKVGTHYDSIVITMDSGQTNRVEQFTEPKVRFQLDHNIKTLADVTTVMKFFHARKGRLCGFRFKDLTDYQATNQNLGTSDGLVASYQLRKAYVSGSITQYRTIKKPTSGTVTIFGNATPITSGFTLNYTTGVLLFTLGTLTITFTASTKRFTRSAGDWTADGVVAGRKIIISGSVSNNATFTVTSVVSATILEVSETVVNEGPLAVTVNYPPASGVVLTWTGEFRVPVRFDTDVFEVSIDGFEPHSISTLELTEIVTPTPGPLPTVTLSDPNAGATVTVSGCTIDPLPEVNSVTKYISFPGAGFAAWLRFSNGDPRNLLNGAANLTVAMAVSHLDTASLGTAFDIQQQGLTPGMRIEFSLGGIIVSLGPGGALLEASLAGGTGNCQYLAGHALLNNISERFNYHPGWTYGGMHIFVVTFDWANHRIFASGSASGERKSDGNQLGYGICTKYGIFGVLPIVQTGIVSKYIDEDDWATYPLETGIGAAFDFGAQDATSPVKMRMYEMFMAVNYLPVPPATTVAILHQPLINYLAGLYGHGVTRRAASAIFASHLSWFRADEGVIVIPLTGGTVDDWIAKSPSDWVNLEYDPGGGSEGQPIQLDNVFPMPLITEELKLAKV